MIEKDICYEIIGACYEVHKELGCGFLEAVYQEALQREFKISNIPSRKEVLINIPYKGDLLKKYYHADFICYGEILLELKALSSLDSSHEAQVLNYLKATGLKLALLINFGEQSSKFKRIILSNSWI